MHTHEPYRLAVRQLFISIQGDAQTPFINKFTELVIKHECQLNKLKYRQFESIVAGMFLLSGPWHAIAKLETAIQTLAEELNLSISIHPTQKHTFSQAGVVYFINLTALAELNAFSLFCDFVTASGLLLLEASQSEFSASASNTPMTTINLQVMVPTTLPLSDFREYFISFCDEYNIDGIIEPERPYFA